MLSRNRVSPAISLFSAGIHSEMLPWVWPGVCRTWNAVWTEQQRYLRPAAGVSIAVRAGGRHAQPGGLRVEMIVQLLVVRVHVDRSAGGGLQLRRASDVIDVGVGDHDGLDGEPMPVQDRQDVLDLVARIDHDRLPSGLVAEDRAVALQHSDGKNFMDHFIPIVSSDRILETWTPFFPIAMRWLHLASVIVLVGGIFYARVVVGDMARGFKPLAYVAIGAILVSGLYNFLSKGHALIQLSDVVWNQNAVSPACVRGDDPVQGQEEIIDWSCDHQWGDRGDRRVSAMDHAYDGQRRLKRWLSARFERVPRGWTLSSRGRLRITGEDRARLLNAMTTNQVQSLTPGQGCYVFFLNAQGRILGDANLFCFEDHLLLDTEPETRQKLADIWTAISSPTMSRSRISPERPRPSRSRDRRPQRCFRALGAGIPLEAMDGRRGARGRSRE